MWNRTVKIYEANLQLSEIRNLQVISTRNPFHLGFALFLKQCPIKYQAVNYLFIFPVKWSIQKRDSRLTAVGTNPSQKGYSTERQCFLGAVWLETVVLHTTQKFKRNNFSVKVHWLLYSENNLFQTLCFWSCCIRILNLFAIYIPQGHAKWIKALFCFHEL